MSGPDRQPVSVARNQWTEIPVPELGEWTPLLRLSVILPFYESSRELRMTLAALAEQSYPSSLIQAIIVDDGSPTDPPRLPESLPYQVEVITQEDLGYGLARARNRGAKAAEGEILVFLDSDMIPEHLHLEAHARWHHAARRLVTVGFRRHAEFDGVSESQLIEAMRGDAVLNLFTPGSVTQPEWIEAHFSRTDELLGPYEDFYLVMSGGNLGIDRDLYWEAGGTDESFTRWGGEDNELAYRMLQLGAVVVPERRALAWHQGEGHEPSDAELQALRLQKPKMQSLIPDRSTRAASAGRSYERPYLTVFVEPRSQSAEVAGLTVDAILASDFTDLVVGVGALENADDSEWMESSFGADHRVILECDEETLTETHRFSPAHLWLPAGYGLNADSLDRMVGLLGGPGVGLLHVNLPSPGGAIELARLTLTRAANRARAIEPSNLDEAIGRMFGERWISGTSVGIWAVEDVHVAAARIRARLRPWLERDHAEQLEEAFARITEIQGRRSLRLIDGLGSVMRARSSSDLRVGLASIKQGLFRGSKP